MNLGGRWRKDRGGERGGGGGGVEGCPAVEKLKARAFTAEAQRAQRRAQDK